MTRRYREPRDELDKLYRLLDDKGVATTEEMREVYDLPVGEQPDMTTLRLTDRAADVLARFTPEVRGSGPGPSRWGDEIAHVLALLESENPRDLEPGTLRDRPRVPQGGKRMVVPRAARQALEKHREAAQAAFARERRGPRAVSPSDIAEYLGERVLAGRLQHEQTASKQVASKQVRNRKGAKR